MGIESELANELIKEMNHLIDEVFEIPRDVFAEVGLSAMAVEVYESAKGDPELGNFDRQLTEAKANLKKLCDSAPNVPARAVTAISLAYASVGLCFDDRNSVKEGEASIVRTVVEASKIMGMALGMIAESPATHEAKRRQVLSVAGKMGAKAKHQKPNELKNWALSQAKRLHGADAVVARKLAAMLPTELADASKNPGRLIYDTLREARKPPG